MLLIIVRFLLFFLTLTQGLNTSFPENQPYKSRNATDLRILVVLSDYADKNNDCGNFTSTLFWQGSPNIHDHFLSLSQHRLNVTGDIAGPYLFSQFTVTGNVCGDDVLLTEAVQIQVTQDNYNLKDYNTLVIITPHIEGCSAGSAGVFEDCTLKTAETCSVIVRKCLGNVVTHEIGHNLNMGHAGWDVDDNNVIDNLGDASDVMSFASWEWTTLNGAHMWQMKWVQDEFFVEGQHLENGEYGIGSLDVLVNVPQVYRFPVLDRVAHTVEPLNKAYFVSVRTSQEMPESYRNKVHIHHYLRRYQACVGQGCIQLFQAGQQTGLVRLLSVGENYTFSDLNLTLSFIRWNDNHTATLRIWTTKPFLPTPSSSTQHLVWWWFVVPAVVVVVVIGLLSLYKYRLCWKQGYNNQP